jgi:pimeloyl-ACP methyl ester carboxylesterase
MTPFFFGSRDRRLFGVYEAAAPGSLVKRAAVLCNPWGSEYIYAHRSLRQLAIRMSVAGFDTLRFDYFGTGDSAGDITGADLRGWEDDIELAIEETQDMAGVARVSLVGLRLGATLAVRVAARHARHVDAVVAWNPVMSGPDYLKSLAVPPDFADRRDGGATVAETVTVNGFSLTDAMCREIAAIDLAPQLAAPLARSLLLITDRSTAPAGLAGHPGSQLEIRSINDLKPWIEDPDNMGAVPVVTIQAIADWLS